MFRGVGPAPNPKVLKDWHSSGLSEVTTAAEVDQLTNSIDGVVEAMVYGGDHDEASGHKRKALRHSPPELAPNREMAMALDNALRAGGLSLGIFLPAKRLEPLRECEFRYFVTLPADMQVEGTSSTRACIWDKVVGTTRVEMPRSLGPDGKVFMPSLHKTCDEGSIGLPMAHWADLFVGLRSTLLEDKWHRLWNDLKSGLVSSKLWIVVCERTVVWNLMTAPFQNHGFGSVIHSAAKEYFSTRSIECPIFCSLFEDPMVYHLATAPCCVCVCDCVSSACRVRKFVAQAFGQGCRTSRRLRGSASAFLQSRSGHDLWHRAQGFAELCPSDSASGPADRTGVEFDAVALATSLVVVF